MTASLQVIILTLNEADMIAGCIQSLAPLEAPILVVDSGSTDQTTQIAPRLGAYVVSRTFDGFADQRNTALELVDSDWVLFVDADERLSPNLCQDIRETISTAAGDVAGYWFARRNLAFGNALRGGGWWPDYQARLLRRGKARYRANAQVHESVMFDGPSFVLSHPIVHLNYRTRREFIRQQRRYTELRCRMSDAPRPRPRRYLGGPAREFVRRFFILKGYLDGLDGLFMAGVLAIEEFRSVRLMRRRQP